MATPGMLVKVIAEAFREPVPTVTQHDRNLAVAGLRTMAGQGKLAAHVTPLDAARLIVAVNGSRFVKDSVDTVRRYSETVPLRGGIRPYQNVNIPGLADLPDNHSLIDALTVIVAAAANGVLLPNLNQPYVFNSMLLTMDMPNTNASIRIHGPYSKGKNTSADVKYHRSYTGKPMPPDDAGRDTYKRWHEAEEAARTSKGIDLPDGHGRRILSEIHGEVFLLLGNLLRETGKTDATDKVGGASG
jgi:hypothetical protein